MNLRLPRILVIELVIIATGILGYFAIDLLARFGHLLLIFAFSILLTYALLPIVNWFAKPKWMKRGIAVLIVYLLMFAVVSVFIALISVPLAKQVEQLSNEYPRYSEQVKQFLPAAQTELDNRSIGINVEQQVKGIAQQLAQYSAKIVAETGSILIAVFGTLSSLVIVLFVTAYFLISGGQFVDWIIGLFPKRRQRMVKRLAADYHNVLSGYVRGHLLLAMIVFTTVTIFTAIIGLPYYTLVGLVAGITSLIPVVGAFLGVVLPVTLALFINPILVPVFIIFFIILNEITDKLLYPRIVGKAVHIHPLVIVFAVLAGAQVAGIAGALLATPVLALAKVTIVALRNSTGYARV